MEHLINKMIFNNIKIINNEKINNKLLNIHKNDKLYFKYLYLFNHLNQIPYNFIYFCIY